MVDVEADRYYPLSWEELHLAGKKLAALLKQKGQWEKMVCVTRGGLIPAAIVAQQLNILEIETISATSYRLVDTFPGLEENIRIVKPVSEFVGDGDGWLVVDDIADTGRTFGFLRQIMPKAHFASIYAKPLGLPTVDTIVTEVSQKLWVGFPWQEMPLNLPVSPLLS